MGRASSAIKASRDILSASFDVRSVRDMPSWPFARLGQTLGLHSLRQRRWRQGIEYLRGPLISVRHFEVPYAYSALPRDAHGRWLDVSSPRVFPIYASYSRCVPFEVWNPDPGDLEVTRMLSKSLGVHLKSHALDVSALADRPETYRCITSISVIEHIDGNYDDQQAVTWMVRALEAGGILILTVPVAPTYRLEYRPSPVYPTQPYTPGRGYFFQRWYDWPSLQSRVLSRLVGLRIVDITFAGERRRGIYEEYQAMLRLAGNRSRTHDASWYYENFREYERWDDLPGMGVAGIVAAND